MYLAGQDLQLERQKRKGGLHTKLMNTVRESLQEEEKRSKYIGRYHMMVLQAKALKKTQNIISKELVISP